jgi:hypothetical protein
MSRHAGQLLVRAADTGADGDIRTPSISIAGAAGAVEAKPQGTLTGVEAQSALCRRREAGRRKSAQGDASRKRPP